jgi:flagellar hook assembly protein FlgD
MRQEQKPTGRMNLLGMIGQGVVADIGRIDHIKGNIQKITFDVPDSANIMEFSVLDAQGEVVQSKKVNVTGKKSYEFVWDGSNSNGFPVGSGTYNVIARVKNQAGESIPIVTSTKGKIVGIDFKGDKNYFILDNGNKVEFSSVKSIGSGVFSDTQPGQNEFNEVDPTQPMKMVNGKLRNVSGKQEKEEEKNFDINGGNDV